MATPSLPSSTSRSLEPEGESKMSFLEHLVELRKRLLYSAVAIGAGMVLGFFVAERVYNLIAQPMLKALGEAHLTQKLYYSSPTGVINLLITIGLYLGVVIASPVVLYQIWLFIAPGLYKHERRAVVVFIFSGTFLFLSGIAFGYFVMLPYVLKFLIGFTGPFQPLISVNDYFDFILVVMLGLGLVFEMPVLIFFLSLFGIVTPKFLWKNIRYAILIITIIAAVITPTPDATTMLVFMAPMVLLYFIGIGVSYMVQRRRLRDMAAGEGTT